MKQLMIDHTSKIYYMLVPLVSNLSLRSVYHYNSKQIRVPYEVCTPSGVIIDSNIFKINQISTDHWSNINDHHFLQNHLYKLSYLKNDEELKKSREQLMVDIVHNTYNSFTINSNNQKLIHILFTSYNFCNKIDLIQTKFMIHYDHLELNIIEKN